MGRERGALDTVSRPALLDRPLREEFCTLGSKHTGHQQRRHRLLLRSRIPRRAYLSQAGSWEELHSHYSDTEFKQYYRVSRNQFNKLLQLILARFPSYQGIRRKGALDVRLKLGSGLRFLAGGMYLDIMRSHFQRKTTFYDHLNETLVVIQRCISIKFPTDSAELGVK